MKRRTFVRTAAAGVVGAAAASGSASAGEGRTWYVSPENYEDPEHDDEFFVEDPFTGDTVGTSEYGAAGETLVWVHGYNIERDEAQGDVFAKRDLVDTYWSTSVDLYGFIWNGHDDWAFGGLSAADFETGENHAWQSATNLAKFLHVLDNQVANAGGGKIHLGAHSLGGRVVLEALKNIVDHWYSASIETVSMVGAAVDDDQIHDKFHAACEHVDGAVWNYHNYEDGILELYHSLHNLYGARAIGEVGAWTDSSHPLPYTWNDVDVTDRTLNDEHVGNVESHVNYLDPDWGVPDLVFPPASDDGSDGGGGGGGGGTCEPHMQTVEEEQVSTQYVQEDPSC